MADFVQWDPDLHTFRCEQNGVVYGQANQFLDAAIFCAAFGYDDTVRDDLIAQKQADYVNRLTPLTQARQNAAQQIEAAMQSVTDAQAALAAATAAESEFIANWT